MRKSDRINYFVLGFGVGGNLVTSSLWLQNNHDFMTYAVELTIEASNHRIIKSSIVFLRLERGTRGSAKPKRVMQQHIWVSVVGRT
jgi:hypothetical protein